MEILKTISIAGIVSFLITLFNKEHDKYIKNQDEYFNNVLAKFYEEYKKNKNIDIVKFYLSYCNYSNSYIPPYVHFLIDEKKYDALKRAFFVDYYDLYPSFNNIVYKTVIYFINIIDFLYSLSMILLIAVLIGIILLILGLVGFMNVIVDWKDLGVIFIYALAFFGLFKFSVSYLDKNDIYSLNKERIIELINSKQNRYYKIIDKIYL